ncbi:hypothetical protein BSKO_06083 [Bryopsis sp. KO-2023]|nr:hypothetical protein BSKO_06083 [Bryopsis sp. KO-2023]
MLGNAKIPTTPLCVGSIRPARLPQVGRGRGRRESLRASRLQSRHAATSGAADTAGTSEGPSSEEPHVPGWGKVLKMRWDRIPWEGTIEAVNQGGCVVSVEGIRGFIPFVEMDPSRLPKERTASKDYLVGEKIRAKVAQVNRATYQCVLSETDQIFRDSLDDLKVGNIVVGVITNITDYGAFVSVISPDGVQHGVYGMIHRSEVSWNQGDGPEDVMQPGDEVKVMVTAVEKGSCRLRLSLRQTQADPIEQNLDTLMPLDTETVSDLQWKTSGIPLPGLELLVEQLRHEEKVDSVEFGRYAEVPRAVSQDLEVWLSREEVSQGYTIVSRAGRSLQEVHVTTAMSRDEMKTRLADLLKKTP